ncbi:mucin-4-like [Trachinotus anak]|uniref:mucin-4-like n=1 Tax=Trachinotus anak TaxID=443729 RepID=UPI0039F1ED4C
MAFANLFTGLSAVDEDVGSPGHTAFAHRNKSDMGKRGNARKRKTQSERTGPDKKKCYQPQTSRTYNTKYFKDGDNMQNTDSEPASSGFTKEVMHNNEAGRNNMYHKGLKAKNNFHMGHQQQWKKKTEEHKNQRKWKHKGRHIDGGGWHQTRATARMGRRDGKRNDNRQDVLMKRTRFMTEEFKDMNALLLDGRLLCRHFLWGRCIKGDNCQLEHIQGYNDLFKEPCKFYIQGLCAKGESCPYMHKSIPCKFFHKKGKCSQGEDCKFSHEPLNEITERLLDEALKRENDLYELAKKAEQESSGPPTNTDGPEITEENQTPDILIQPLRPNFYNSGEMTAEQEALLCKTEHLSDITETAVPPQASDSAQPHSPLLTNLNHEEPVCYSVEAVLGPQLFKPFPSFFTTPGSQESAPLSVAQTSSDSTSGSADQNELPNSVNVVKSCKSVRNSTSGHIPAPPAPHNVSFTSKTAFEELADPWVRRNTVNKSKEQMLNSKNEGLLPFAPPKGKSLTFTPKHPRQLKPHLSALASNSEASVKPLCPSSGFSEFRGRASVPAEPVTSSAKTNDSGNSVSHHFAAKQPTGHSKMTQYFTDTTAEGSSKMAHCGGLSVGCNQTQKSSFCSLFASPVTDGLEPTPDFVTACPQGFYQSSCPSLQPEDARHKNIDVKTNKASAFLSLFAAPLSAAPDPCGQSADYTSHLSDSKQRASNSSSPLSPPVKTVVKQTSHRPTPPKYSLSPKNKNKKDLAEPVNQPAKQQVSPVCSHVSVSATSSSSTPCGDSVDPSTTQAQQQLPDISPLKASANSVLKTLFLSLSPYQQDGEQQDSVQIIVSSESETKDKSSMGCVIVKQQQKSKKRRQKQRLKTQSSHQQSTERTVASSTGCQPSFQTSLISVESAVRSSLSSPVATEPQVRQSGTHNLPFKPVVQLMQHHTRPRLRNTSQEEKQVNGNVAVTPLKDLFKTLDTTVFHFGH